MSEYLQWLIHATGDEKFPWRISIVQGQVEKIALLAQSRWPGPGQQVFCLREDEPPEALTEPVEQVAVAHLRRFGRKVSLVLERNRHKRCDLLFIKRPYKNRPGEYEQIFFRTQKSLREHKSRGRTNLFGEHNIEVVIDSRERYPWKFSKAEVRRSPLPVGDYALIHQDRHTAVVERKTFENLLSDIGTLQLLHQQLSELSTWPHSAVVIEAQYADFLMPDRTGRWSVTHLARVLAELTTLHADLPIIFAGNRKMANQWTQGFFEAVARKLAEPASAEVAEVTAGYRATPTSGGDEQQVRYLVGQELPDRFSIDDLQSSLPDVKKTRLRSLLGRLRDEGRLERVGHGRAARWQKVPPNSENH